MPKMLVPALVLVGSGVALMEILFHARHASLGEEEMNLFGITFNSQDWLPTIVVVMIGAGAFYLVRLLAPQVKEAWDMANHAEGQ